jgi:hypothetical protein
MMGLCISSAFLTPLWSHEISFFTNGQDFIAGGGLQLKAWECLRSTSIVGRIKSGKPLVRGRQARRLQTKPDEDDAFSGASWILNKESAQCHPWEICGCSFTNTATMNHASHSLSSIPTGRFLRAEARYSQVSVSLRRRKRACIDDKHH